MGNRQVEATADNPKVRRRRYFLGRLACAADDNGKAVSG